MRLSETGLNFIKQWERFVATPYDDGYGNPTIGYGHKIKPGEHFTRISEPEASQLLAQDVAWAEDAVNRQVRVPLTQSQFDALTSLIINWGPGNFAQSLLLKRLNAGDYAGAADRLGVHPVTSGGKYSAGLQRRRQEEKAIFLSGGLPTSSAPSSLPSDQVHRDPGAPDNGASLMPWLAIGGAIVVGWVLLMDD